MSGWTHRLCWAALVVAAAGPLEGFVWVQSESPPTARPAPQGYPVAPHATPPAAASRAAGPPAAPASSPFETLSQVVGTALSGSAGAAGVNAPSPAVAFSAAAAGFKGAMEALSAISGGPAPHPPSGPAATASPFWAIGASAQGYKEAGAALDAIGGGR